MTLKGLKVNTIITFSKESVNEEWSIVANKSIVDDHIFYKITSTNGIPGGLSKIGNYISEIDNPQFVYNLFNNEWHSLINEPLTEDIYNEVIKYIEMAYVNYINDIIKIKKDELVIF